MADSLFIAYAGDCLLQGRLELPEGRLTDFLNATESLTLRDVVVQAHDDGHVVHLDQLVVSRREIFAIEARGPRGQTQKRVRTRPSRMDFVLGPYRVLGQLHAPPGADPLSALARRMPLVPLTVATIAYKVGSETRLHDVETLIVNRDLVEWVRPQALDIAFENMPQVGQITEAGTRGSRVLYFAD
jgi:hypothetical protein